jgi:hypothetical protein
VRQLLLLPALMLRRELHQQQASSPWDAQPVSSLISASKACLVFLQYWKDMRELTVSKSGGAVAGGPAATAAAAGTTGEATYFGLLNPVLHELLQLLMHLLLGLMQAAQPCGSSSSRHEGASGSGHQNSASASFSTSTGAGNRSAAASSDVKPAAAATVLSCIMLALLPVTAQVVLAQAAGTPDRNAPSSSSSSSSSSGSSSNQDNSAVAWVPVLLRLIAVLEQGLRFEVQYGATQTELHSMGLGAYAGVAVDSPIGSALWLATSLLLAPAGEKNFRLAKLRVSRQQRGTSPHCCCGCWTTQRLSSCHLRSSGC